MNCRSMLHLCLHCNWLLLPILLPRHDRRSFCAFALGRVWCLGLALVHSSGLVQTPDDRVIYNFKDLQSRTQSCQNRDSRWFSPCGCGFAIDDTTPGAHSKATKVELNINPGNCKPKEHHLRFTVTTALRHAHIYSEHLLSTGAVDALLLDGVTHNLKRPKVNLSNMYRSFACSHDRTPYRCKVFLSDVSC